MVSRKAVRSSVPAHILPDFAPVPRKPRHDGWTPERQKAFVEALADTGCVAIACRMVNMSQPSFYQLRRQPGATSFRAAADAAQALGLQCVKDEAFERAMHGQLVPVFVGGRLMGFRRKKNDRLLMFILRHYGQDAQGRKTTVNYFSTRATAGAATKPSPLQGRGLGEGEADATAAAQASTTTIRTTISGPDRGVASAGLDDTDAANLLNAFEGVALDETAQAEIYRALEACAERRRAIEADPEADGEREFIGAEETDGYLGELESGVEDDWVEYKPEGEHSWESLGEGGHAAEIDKVLAEMEARKLLPSPEAGRGTEGEGLPSGPDPSPEPPAPSPRTPRRAYKKRRPKPPFTPPDEARKAEALAEVEADRRVAAKAEAKRRKARARRSGTVTRNCPHSA